MGLTRRTVLSGGALAGLVGLGGLGLSACGGGVDAPVGDGPAGRLTDDQAEEQGVEIIRYGDDPSQYAELTRPAGAAAGAAGAASKGVVVVVHGGFWRAEYDASLGRPLAASLAEEGWTAWNLEYRRVAASPGTPGGGGGNPATFDDVHAGIDALAGVDGLDTSTVLVLGHSAGGHLATWSAARGRFDRWADVRVPVTGVVSQAGVLDLTTAAEDGVGGTAVLDLVGGPPGPAYDLVDPLRQVPLDVPVRCIHGREDANVPLTQSTAYVAAAREAGADASLTEVEGDHFVLIDPASDAWRRTLRLLDDLR